LNPDRAGKYRKWVNLRNTRVMPVRREQSRKVPRRVYRIAKVTRKFTGKVGECVFAPDPAQ